MFMSKLKTVSAILLAVGLFGVGVGLWLTQPESAPAAQAAPPQVDPPREAARAELPVGMPPHQILARLNDDGKLVVKSTMRFGFAGGGGFGGAPGAGGGIRVQGGGGGGIVGGGAIVNGKMEPAVHTYELKDVQVFDTKGNKVDDKALKKLLKDETVAMAVWGDKLDPLNLRVLKEGTLTFVLPMQGFGPNMLPGGGPVPLPGPGVPGGLPPGGPVPLPGPGGVPGALPPGGGVGNGLPPMPGGGDTVPVPPGGRPGNVLPPAPAGGGNVPVPGVGRPSAPGALPPAPGGTTPLPPQPNRGNPMPAPFEPVFPGR